MSERATSSMRVLLRSDLGGGIATLASASSSSACIMDATV